MGGIRCILAPGFTTGIQKEHGMMDRAVIAWLELNGRYCLVCFQAGWHDKASVYIWAVGWDIEVSGHLQHEIRLPQLPSLGEHRQGRDPGGVTQWRPGIRPGF